MFLPLVDGIFPALVLSGALDDPVGIVEVGLLIFGGSATVAVILAEMDGDRADHVRTVLTVGVALIAVAVLEAALAPTIRGLLDLTVFSRFAGLVILAVAAKTASARIGEILPRPAVIVGLGLVASLSPNGAALVVRTDPGLMARAGAAAGVGVAFALAVAIAGPYLRNAVDIDRFRFGSAVALGILPLGIFGMIPGDAPIALAVLLVTAVFAFDPDQAREPDEQFQRGAASALADSDELDQSDLDEAAAAATETHTDESRAPWL
jgi:hypothetical protein